MPLGLPSISRRSLLVREERGEGLELGSLHRLVGGHAVDLVDADDGGELLLRARGPDRAGDDVPLAEAELAHLIGRDVDVLVPGQIPGDSQEAVALREDVEQPLTGLEVLLGDVLILTATATATSAATPVSIPVSTLALVVVVGAAALT